jgi:bifunctional non-homologous end joining protein LigD
VSADKLGTYRSKRDFDRTAEPAGADGNTAGDDTARFVVQRHRARRLHYDFRLEIDGVLVSWAVPKGPTLDPEVRRMAARTEDHPLEYAAFEGVIPKGEYGGGDVIVWDEGTFEVHKHPDAGTALADGELHVELFGHKLRGRFVLVRTRGDGDGEQWLLLHKHDEHAEDGWDAEDHPHSVKSGRTNDEVAADPAAMWSSDAPAARAEVELHHLRDDDPELQALDALGKSGTWEFRGRELRLTNLDKVLFPGRDGEPPVTKRELVRHYATIAPLLVPHLRDRPVNLHRYPNGVEEPGFWHKAVPKHAPEWIERWDNTEADDDETRTYFVASEAATIAWLANYGAIELHPWTSTTAAPRQPDYALIDLDPGEDTSWEDLLVLARLHRTALEHLGVHGAPKVTGRRGIQIWVPVTPGYTFEDTRNWVEAVSRAVGRIVPELVSWEWGVKERRGLARLDYTQNAINKTLVAPYSARPSAGAPVSVPITWDELDDEDLRPDRWTIRTVRARLEETGDLFGDLRRHAQRLPALS